jgi:hypothetical protein
MATIVEEREPTPERILKRIIPYSVGVRSFDQGDACFSITAFDDYVYFSLTEEVEGEEIPMDLTGYGSIYLRFKNRDIDISIKAISETQEIDPSRGEVTFRISTDDSRRILATDISTFTIVSRLDIADDKSYENVIFQGKFLKPDESSEALSRYDQLYNAEADSAIQALEDEIATLTTRSNFLKEDNTAIKYDIESLSVKFDELDKKYKQALTELAESETGENAVKKPFIPFVERKIPSIEIKASALERSLPTPPRPTSQEKDPNLREIDESGGAAEGPNGQGSF